MVADDCNTVYDVDVNLADSLSNVSAHAGDRGSMLGDFAWLECSERGDFPFEA